MTPKEIKALDAAQKKAEQVERPPLPDEINVDKLHAVAQFKPRVITAEMMQVAAARRRKATAEYRAQMKRQKIADRLSILARDCGPRLLDPVTLKQADYDLYHKDQSPLLDEIEAYLEQIEIRIGRGDGMILVGKPGTGKDHLCVRVARQAVIDCEADARWIDGKSLWPMALEGVRGGPDKLVQFISPTILILSDPVDPKEPLAPYQHSALSRIINERYQAKRPTFVTANCKDLKEMEARTDSRLMSRLKDGALKWLCNWPDYRDKE